jgi:acyl-CoA synthetase (AMP-forming)/AMP-acid ligase II/aryl carrier-like protein
MSRFASLPAALDANLREDRHIVFIDGEDRERRLSFAELRQRALRLLGGLQQQGLRPGDALILFIGDNERFLEMFWACVLGGVIPVPLAVGAGDEHRRKLLRVFAQFDEAWVYGEAAVLERMQTFAASEGLHEDYARLRARSLLVGGLSETKQGQTAAREADDLAFIQYSSGSTSEPKGVMLSHRNLTANIASICQAAHFSNQDVALSWMPLSHDMGLIGFHLNMLATGATHAIMRTDLFARRPLLWLAKATELRATVLCSPNFGYQHYLKQYESRRPQGLDLSRVRLLFNGAEPISADLCSRFLDTLAPHGLRGHCMFTVYGLAEASLAVSFPQPGAPWRAIHLDRASLQVGEAVRTLDAARDGASAFVMLGKAVPGTELRIGDDAGGALGEGLLGHVLIRGDNVTRGYFRDDAATARVRSSDGWLDTGDLGFLADGELVIAGRAKDIIFVNGQNWYPHDLEHLALQIEGLETNKIAMAGVRKPGAEAEEIAAFVQHRGSLADFVGTVRALRRLLGQQLALELGYVVPVTQIPKTTSGKLQRHRLARAFEQGEFDDAVTALEALVQEIAPSDPAEPVVADSPLQRLQEICARLIPEKRVTPQTNLFEINLNSLTLARIHEAIDQAFPGQLDVAELFDHPTLEALAQCLSRPPPPPA